MPIANPLFIQFCQHIAVVWCEADLLRQELGRYYQHSLTTEDAPDFTPQAVVVTYRVVQKAVDAWEVWCHDKLVHIAPEPFFIFIYLTRDVMAKLTTHGAAQIVFHAAGVAQNEQGVILCAPSNAGKSTLAAWLTATGFDFLTDEMVAVDAEARNIRGFTCPIVLKPESSFVWQRWVSLEAAQSQMYHFDGTTWLDPTLLRPDSVRSKTHLSLLVIPAYQAGSDLVSKPLSPMETVFHLLPRVINFANFPDRGLARIKHLARNVTAYSLTYADLNAASAWIEQTLTQLSYQRI